jgi:hypothetical protein
MQNLYGTAILRPIKRRRKSILRLIHTPIIHDRVFRHESIGMYAQITYKNLAVCGKTAYVREFRPTAQIKKTAGLTPTAWVCLFISIYCTWSISKVRKTLNH